MKLKVVVASENPTKVNCTKNGFSQVFKNHIIEIIPKSFPSGVGDQPMTDGETLTGAMNRAKNAKKGLPQADYWVGIEGGLAEESWGMHAFAWVYILDKNQQGRARTATFQLPEKIVALIKRGIELGEADDIVFKRENSKQKNGAVGILTHDLIDRASYYEPAVILALIPFVNSDLY